jgi:formylglycine-generating enzyme required for sulfatase activity
VPFVAPRGAALKLGVRLIPYGLTGDPFDHFRHVPTVSSGLGNFLLQAHEVTVAEFMEFATSTKMKGFVPKGPGDFPITGVTLATASAYAKWFEFDKFGSPKGTSVTLPTREQYLAAARGGDERPFPWGSAFAPSRAACRASTAGAATRIGSFPEDESPYGIRDLVGSVSEWVLSETGGTASPLFPLRLRPTFGGSFHDDTLLLERAFRSGEFPQKVEGATDVGFRLAVTFEEIP